MTFAELRRSSAFPDIAIGVAMVVLATIMAYSIWTIRAPSYAYVGPQVFPFAVAFMMGAIGIGLGVSGTVRAMSGLAPSPPTEPRSTAIWWVVAGLVANLIGLILLGFILAALIQYVLTARGFGSRRWLRDSAFGLALALVAYVLFSLVLKINIPAGPFIEVVSEWIA